MRKERDASDYHRSNDSTSYHKRNSHVALSYLKRTLQSNVMLATCSHSHNQQPFSRGPQEVQGPMVETNKQIALSDACPTVQVSKGEQVSRLRGREERREQGEC